MKSRWPYIIVTIISLIIGIIIFKTSIPFVRNSLGDFLVVMFMYSTVKVFNPKFSPLILVTAILIFSIGIEVLQFFRFPQLFGTDKLWVKLILGSRFEWTDILAYFLGVLAIYWLDNKYLHEVT